MKVQSRTQTIKQVFSGQFLRRAIWAAAIVGSILNVINQADVIFGPGRVILWKLVLTYLVPFAVVSYGSYSALRSSISDY